MDSFEFNKIAGAVLGTLLFVMALERRLRRVVHPAKPAIPGYDLPSAAPEGKARRAGGARADAAASGSCSPRPTPKPARKPP